MIRILDILKPNNPRRFAGCLVLWLAIVLAPVFAIAGTWTFHGGGGLVNSKESFAVKYVSAGSTIATSQFTLSHSDATYHCTGWYTVGYVTKMGDVNATIFVSSENLDLYAKWEQDTFSIVFDANVGSGSMDSLPMVATVKKNLPLCTFTRSSHRFLGWSDDKDAVTPKYVDGASVSFGHDRNSGLKGDVKLYAVWGRQFTIKFDKNGGRGTMANQLLNEGVTTNLTKCGFAPQTGYKFDGWSSTSIGDFEDESEVTYDSAGWKGTMATLTARWVPISYRIRFSANSPSAVSGSMNDQEMEYGDSQELTRCGFTRVGYAFAGWAKTAAGEAVYADEEDVVNLSATDGAIVPLFAKWNPVSYVVAFDGNGGSGEMADLACEYDRVYALPANAFTREGASFLGWTTNGSSAVVFEDGASISNLCSTADATNVLKAVWSKITYYIAFDGNGGSGSVPTMDCEYGTAYSLPSNDFVRTGYAFTGWTTNAATAAVYQEGESVSSLTTVADSTIPFYAAWRPISYRVTFDANGGHGEMAPMTNFYDVACELTSNTFACSGREFAGWSTNTTGSVVYADGAVVSNLVTVENGEYPLFAQWMTVTNDIMRALDNGDLFSAVDVGADTYVSAVSDSTAVNGNCVKIASVVNKARITKNKGADGFRIYLDTPGELTFRWKVVNVPRSEIHRNGWSAKVSIENSIITKDVLFVSRNDDYTNPELDWADFKVTVTNVPASLQFRFVCQNATYTSDMYALFDYVRWNDGKEERGWLEKYFPGQIKSLDDVNPLKGGTYRDDYVAGTDPTNVLSRFTMMISITNGVPYITWDPDLGSKRVYELYGSSDIETWITPTNATHRFFKVSVSLP